MGDAQAIIKFWRYTKYFGMSTPVVMSTPAETKETKKRKDPGPGTEKKSKKAKVDTKEWYLDVLVYGNDAGGDYPTVNFFDADGEDVHAVYKKALAAKGKNVKVTMGKARVISKSYGSYEAREAAYEIGRCMEEFYEPGDQGKFKTELFRRDPAGEEEDYFNVEPCVDCRHFEKCNQVYCGGMEKFI